MPMINTWVYTKQVIDWEKIQKATRNIYQYVAQKPFASKKHPEDIGVTLTLLILFDDMDYGEDKNGRKRDNNVYNTFDVTILNGQSFLSIKKGEKVSLIGFLPEKSYAIGFDLLLRFRDIKKIEVKNGTKN